MRRVSMVLLLLLAACRSIPMKFDAEMVGREMGLPPLRTEEIRLWSIDYIREPSAMVRLTHTDGAWEGELWRFGLRSDEGIFHPLDEWQCGCTRTIRVQEWVACRVTERKRIDWDGFARRLQEADITMLPEQPKPEADANGLITVVTDENSLIIESRGGGRHQLVKYDDFYNSAPARRAGEASKIVDEIDALETCPR